MYYLDWMANVVMVKKANGKWRMCVDFMDLNKADRMMGREKVDENKRRPTRIKGVTGPAWPCLTPTDIYTRKYLAPHD